MAECNHLKNHLAVVDERGFIMPCCIFVRPNEELEKPFLKYKIDNHEVQSLNEVLTSDVWNDIRKKMENENIPHCTNCWKVESSNITSKRQHYEQIYPKVDKVALEDIEIALDYTCNMMCRICRPGQSSKWKSSKSLVEKLDQLYPYPAIYKTEVGLPTYRNDIKRLIENTDWSNIKRVRIVGGEPFYSKNLLPFLKKLDKDAGIENVELCFNTNGSIFPDDEILRLLRRCKHLSIDFSVDAIGDLADVIRPGDKGWKTIDANIQKWYNISKGNKKQYYLAIHTTISLLNLNALQPIFDYCVNSRSHEATIHFNFYVLTHPEFLSIHQLSPEVRKKFLLKTDIDIKQHKGVGFVLHEVNRALLSERETKPMLDVFLKATDEMDSFHGVSFKEANPQIYNLIKEQAK